MDGMQLKNAFETRSNGDLKYDKKTFPKWKKTLEKYGDEIKQIRSSVYFLLPLPIALQTELS